MSTKKITSGIALAFLVLASACSKDEANPITNDPIIIPVQSTAQASVSLAAASNFALLCGAEITNTGPTIITGDIGLSPGTPVMIATLLSSLFMLSNLMH